MTDAVISQIRSPWRIHSRRSGSDHRDSIADLAGRPLHMRSADADTGSAQTRASRRRSSAGGDGKPSEQRSNRSPARIRPPSSSDAARRPALAGLRQWLLETLVISFAYGGCIHNIHPDYIDFIREIDRNKSA